MSPSSNAKEHDVGDEQRRCRDAAACRAEARWGRRSRNASHSPARQRRWRRAAAHPLSGSPEASAHVQVQRKYGWELSNRVCRARGAAAHACAPGLSTGRRLMPMPARCGAAAPCRGAATVRRSPHTRRVLRRVLLGRGCLCGAHRARATAATTKRLHACACEGADENSWQSRPRHACALQLLGQGCCSEPCGDLLTELLSPGGRKRLTLRMLDKVSETAAGLSA